MRYLMPCAEYDTTRIKRPSSNRFRSSKGGLYPLVDSTHKSSSTQPTRQRIKLVTADRETAGGAICFPSPIDSSIWDHLEPTFRI